MNEPIWNLPPVTTLTTVMEAEALKQLPWHVADYGIDKNIWPLLKAVASPVVIGLVDTGVGKAHFDDGGELDGQVLEVADFTNSQRSGPWDSNGHGSHTGGIMVSKSFGIANQCCKVVSAKCLGDGGIGYDSWIAQGIRWCVSKGAKVLNLSLGSNKLSPEIDHELREALAQGVLIVCAAGNDGGSVGEPGAQPYSTTVSATDRNRVITDFSSRGPQVTVCAPGKEIMSLGVGKSFAVMSGTSMAAPWISAYLGCKLAYDKLRGKPSLQTPDQVLEWLTKDADDLGAQGRDPLYGVGIPNSLKFMEEVPVPAEPPSEKPVIPTEIPVSMTFFNSHYSGVLKKDDPTV